MEGMSKKLFSKLGLMYFFGTLIICGVQLGAIGLAGVLAPELLEDSNWSLIISMIPMYLIGMPLMMLLIKRVPAEKAETHAMSAGKLVLAMIMAQAIMYCSNLVGTLFTFFISLVKGSAVGNVLQSAVSDTNVWIRILILVICAPIVEEIIFRKLLVDRTACFGEGVAVVLSGVMFGLFHGNLSQFVYAFTLGMFLAFIYVKTRKVQYTIAIHMVINFIGSILSVWILELIDYDSLAVLQGGDEAAMMQAMGAVLPGLLAFMIYFLCLIGIVIAGIVLLIVFRKRFCLNPGSFTLPKGKRFSTIFLNVGMGLFCLFWIGMIIVQLFR